MISIVIISVAVVVKLLLGKYVKKQGTKLNSSALVASGSDALFDAILSTSVLASAIIYLIWKISLEAYVGVIISVFIIKAGLEIMKDTLDDVIGKRENPEVSRKIKELIMQEPEVKGVYDLILFNYGPNKYYSSVHLELPDTMTVDEVDILTRRLQIRIYKESGIILTGVGVYSFNTQNEEAAKIRDTIQNTILSHEWALQMHGFYANTEEKTLRFDVVLSFDVDRKKAFKIMMQEVKSLYPDYKLEILPDIDFTDLDSSDL